SLSSYRPGTFEGWLHRITTNLFLDQARRRQRIRFDAFPDDVADKLPGLLPSPDRELFDDMFDADIESALAALSPEFRAAVVLCDVEGLSYDEIADVLDVKVGTVRSRIHRGRSMLRKALTHRAPTQTRTRIGGVVDGAPAGGPR
ncbi:MAG: sigma-70 family RNA polymerase sigma factor, partial [Propionibacteriales bacterium]|nr:sigma-70 family RNA polymerase sigma factor [Propionibacteriales bacterium]